MKRGIIHRLVVYVMVVSLMLGSHLLYAVPSAQAAIEGEYEYFPVDAGTTVRISSYNGNDEDVVIPAQLNGWDVIEISTGAFQDKQLKSVTIPNTVERIGYAAFAGNQLTEIIIPSSVMEIGRLAFMGNQLTHVELPSGITTIAEQAFRNNQLTSVTIPDTVTEIGLMAFGENQLTAVELPSSLTTIGEQAFRDNRLASLILPDSLTEIGWAAFRDNQLTTLGISNSLTTINSNTFANNLLTTVNIPSSITTIREDAFRGNQLSTLVIPDHVTEISTGAFSDNSLTEVTLSNGLTTISGGMFRNNQLAEVTIPNSITEIDGGAFANNQIQHLELSNTVTKIGDGAFEANQITELVIPSSVREIEQMAFGQNQISELTIEEGLETIGAAAFMENQLTDLTIPGSVKSIGPSAFNKNQLAKLTIEDGVETIDPYAFVYNQLTEVTLPASVKSVGISAFGANEIRDLMILNPNAILGDNLFDIVFGGNIIYENTFEVTIYGEDPSTARTYALNNGHSFQEISAELENLELDIPGLHFDPNERSFSLVTNASSVVVTPTPVVPLAEVQINQTVIPYGTSSTLIPLDEGLETIVVDVIASEAWAEQYQIALTVDRTDPAIELTPNPVSATNGDVTATADVDGTGSGIASQKWADGERTANFFTAGGTDFTDDFTVSANDTYTVYARDEAGNEAVKTITIGNIHRDGPTIQLIANPTGPTNSNVTVTAAVYSTGSGIASQKWADGERTADFFAAGGTDFTGDFTVSENGAYTVYARDEASNEAVKTITIANIHRVVPVIDLIVNPTAPTNSNVTVTAVVYSTGSEIASQKWAYGERTADFFAAGGTDFTGNFMVSANGMYTVYARDEAGNEAVKTITIANIGIPNTPSPSGSNPAGQAQPVKDPEPKTTVLIDKGIIVIKVTPKDIKEVKQPDGRVVDVVDLPKEIIDQLPKLLDQADRPFVRVEIDDRNPEVRLQLPAGPLGDWMSQHPDIAFEARLNGSSFQLEVNVLDLKQLAAQLGVVVNDLLVSINIKTLEGAVLNALVQAANKQGMKLLSEAIEFQLIVSGGGQTLEVSDFGGTYMMKSIVLDAGATKRNYTAVLYDPTAQTFTFVPAITANLRDGRAESVMRVPHNSIYAVMETEPVKFADMTAHWAKSEVERMASKRIVSGVSKTIYAPDRPITRAEFTALLVRALGIRTEAAAVGNVFEDVPASAWYAAVIEAGARSELIAGVSGTRFAPDDRITREQIAVMLANARMLVTGGAAKTKQPTNALSKFNDAAQISSWARDAVAEAVAAGIIQGVDGDRLAPAATATRAQAAVMLERLLREIEFLE
ncbi:leucine-rich repeat protein [Cohnella sp. LGH]|uniref:leucine-rich repeat protein n=1 Tax=Cohnella sp. LGH TaxID=1619153 RepID=UPI001AD9D8C3|nr:leucine-rich repeat protein [Cohnella sp. LGH]QTH43677.1 leucine-rich repeat protein [Cohnella sp. LGH]